MKEQHCIQWGCFLKQYIEQSPVCICHSLVVPSYPGHFSYHSAGTHKFLFIPEMRLITCKNKQTRKCGSAFRPSISFLFSTLVCCAFWLWKFHGKPKASDNDRSSTQQQQTVNGLEKTTSSSSPQCSITFPPRFACMFINFSNPEKKFNRIERQKVPSKKVQKGFENTKEDLHTLWCEHPGRKQGDRKKRREARAEKSFLIFYISSWLNLMCVKLFDK